MDDIKVEQLDLGELIAALETALAEGDRVLPIGFHNPHSYRGDYCDLAFEPCRDIALSDMLQAARDALDITFQGWKGGDFTMSKHTLCWLAYRGSSYSETIGALSLSLMLESERKAIEA